MSTKAPQFGSCRTMLVLLGGCLAAWAGLAFVATHGIGASQPDLSFAVTTSDPVAVAVAQVNALHRGQVEAAYARWTLSMQKDFPLDEARLAFGHAMREVERLTVEGKLLAAEQTRARVQLSARWAPRPHQPPQRREATGLIACLENGPDGWRVANPLGIGPPIGWLSPAQQQVASDITDLAKRFCAAWAARDYQAMYAMLTKREQVETPRDTFAAWVGTLEPPERLIYVSLRTDQLENNRDQVLFTLYTMPAEKSRVDTWTLVAAHTADRWQVARRIVSRE